MEGVRIAPSSAQGARTLRPYVALERVVPQPCSLAPANRIIQCDKCNPQASPSVLNLCMHNQDPFNRFRKLTRRAFVSAVAACFTGAAAGDADAVWTDYLAWLKGRVVGDLVGLDSYRKVLTEQGVPKPEVERRMKIISERSLKRPEAMRLWFNSMYGPNGAVGPDWPTPFLMKTLRIVRYEEAEELSDWQVGQGGRTGLSVKMLAQKP